MKILIIEHPININKKTKILMKNKFNYNNIDYKFISIFDEEKLNEYINNYDKILVFNDKNRILKEGKFKVKNPDLKYLFNIFKKIEKKVIVYPSNDFYELISSKIYLVELPRELFMPYTKVFYYYKSYLYRNLKNIQKYYNNLNINKIIIKFGYSANSSQVYIYNIKDIFKIYEKIKKFKKYIGKTFLIIVQPYNNIIKERTNEYRFKFINGKMSDIISFGLYRSTKKRKYNIYIPNRKINFKNKHEINLVNLAKKTYKELVKKIKYTPLFIRIDLSWIIDKKLFDKNIVDNKRYYVNEIESLDGTHYFNLPYIDTKNKFVNDIYRCRETKCLKSKRDLKLLLDSIIKFANN